MHSLLLALGRIGVSLANAKVPGGVHGLAIGGTGHSLVGHPFLKKQKAVLPP